MAKSTDDTDGPQKVDRHVGQRVRRRRIDLNMSQERLGEALGVSFQQVQKYEKGTNRISASRLFQIVETLKTSPGYFFEGLDSEESTSTAPFATPATGMAEAPSDEYKLDIGISKEGYELVKALTRIPNPAIRKNVVELVQTIANDYAAQADLRKQDRKKPD